MEPTPATGPVVKSPPTERPGDRYWRAAYLFAGSITLAGLIVRYTIQDRWLFFSTVFYATPLPLILLGAFASVVCTFQLGWSRQCYAWLAMGCVAAGLWWQQDWSQRSRVVTDDSLTILFWNVARREEMEPAALRIREIDADIVALVEAGGAHAERRRFWKEQCPEYDISMLGGGLMLMVKGTAERSIPVELDRGSLWRQVPCEVRGQKLTCAVVDLKSDPYYSRGKVFRQLAELSSSLGEQPLFVVGDFNTPVDSVHYQALRGHLREAFEVAGEGYAPTWPWPAPVLWLDQVWVNEDVEVIRCERLRPVNSDHCPVLTTFRILQKEP